MERAFIHKKGLDGYKYEKWEGVGILPFTQGGKTLTAKHYPSE